MPSPPDPHASAIQDLAGRSHAQQATPPDDLDDARPTHKYQRLERQRDRLVFLVLGLTLLLALSTIFGTVWYLQGRAAQLAEQRWRETLDKNTKGKIRGEITNALTEVEQRRAELHGRLANPLQAHRLLNDTQLWQAHLRTAWATWQRATAIARGEAELVDPPLLNRMRTLERRLTEDEAERNIALLLEKVRFDVLADIAELEPTVHYKRALSWLGVDINKGKPAEVAKRIRQSTIRHAYVNALDHWAEIVYHRDPKNKALVAHLLAITQQADFEPWRDQFRQLQTWQDREKLQRLANEVDFAAQPPWLTTTLAVQLERTGGAPTNVVRQLRLHYPHDFWTNLRLGLLVSGAAKLACFRAAVAVRPLNAMAHFHLGRTLQSAADLPSALAHFIKASELDVRKDQDIPAGYRVHAARVAIQMPTNKADFRRQALGWLKSELAAWKRCAEKKAGITKHRVGRVLHNWQNDDVLAKVRKAKFVTKMPPEEQHAWQEFWANVQALRGRS